ncbi:MAG: type IV toxin-antitoxin system AbiEi family antitoxin domain-containing protein, partial [Actinomycetota bacterium]
MGVDKTLVLLDQTARSQHGLVTSQQAVKILGPHRKSRWVTQRRLTMVQPGVFRLPGAPETWHQALMATALAAEGTVSHRSAAELWGLIQPAGYVEVSIVPGRMPRLRPPAVAHRIKDLHPTLAVERAGLKVTDPVRTIVDLGLVLSTAAVSD